MSIRTSPNQREVLSAISTITGQQEYLTSTAGALNTTGGGSGGGDVQYTDGNASPTHPIGTIPVFNNGGTITAVSVANPLPVTAAVTISGVATAVNQTNASQKTQIVDGSGNVIAATSNALNTSITNASIAVTGTFWQITQPISAASLPLPTGASTSALQTSGNSSLTSIATNTSNIPALGQALAAGSVPVVLTAAQITTLTPPAAITNYALETGGNLATLAGTVTSSVVQTNEKQINGVAPLMGNGVTGTGSQRVTIASDNTAFSVNAIQSGTWTNTVTQTTAANLNATVVQGTAAVIGSPWPVYNGEQNDFTGTFTNATQTTSVTATNLDGYGNILISINGTYGAATAIFEGSDDSGTTWYAVDAARTSGSVIEGGYTSQTNATLSWQINVPGFDSVRVRSTAVASGTVNVRMSASAANGTDGATLSVAGTVANAPVAPTTISNGKTTVTTAGTRVALASSTVVQSVTIKALAANTGTIYVGNSSVSSSNGFQLAAGDTVSLDIANLNTVNIDSSVNGEGVSYAAVT